MEVQNKGGDLIAKERNKKMFSLSYVNLEKDEVEIKNGFKSDKEAYDYIANHKEVLPLKLLIWSEARQCNREIEAFVSY